MPERLAWLLACLVCLGMNQFVKTDFPTYFGLRQNKWSSDRTQTKLQNLGLSQWQKNFFELFAMVQILTNISSTSSTPLHIHAHSKNISAYTFTHDIHCHILYIQLHTQRKTHLCTYVPTSLSLFPTHNHSHGKNSFTSKQKKGHLTCKCIKL